MPNFHPMIVHFPVALIVIVAVCDLIGILTGRRSFIQTATITSVFAAIGAVFAAATGLYAEDTIWHPEAAHELLETHQTLGLVFLGVVIVLVVFRLALRDKIYGQARWIGFILALAASGIVAVGSYLGGEMVYTHGAGVKMAETMTAQADSLKSELAEMKGEPEPEVGESSEHEGHHHEHAH